MRPGLFHRSAEPIVVASAVEVLLVPPPRFAFGFGEDFVKDPPGLEHLRGRWLGREHMAKVFRRRPAAMNAEVLASSRGDFIRRGADGQEAGDDVGRHAETQEGFGVSDHV